MKKKLIAIALTALMLVAFPAAAFAAGSQNNSQSADYTNASATLVGSNENITNLVVAQDSSLVWEAYFTDGTTDGFGTLTLQLTVGDQYNGQTATITVNHADGTVETSTQTVANGVVSVTLTKLSTITVSFNGTSSNASSTSPKTGADIMWIAILTGACAAAAVTVCVARKRTQN